MNLLLSMQRFDDALTVANTCLKLDPFNGQVIDLVNRLQQFKQSGGGAGGHPMQPNVAELEKTVQENPSNYQAAFNLASAYLAMQQNARAIEVLDRVMNDPHADMTALKALITAYKSIGSTSSLQALAQKLEKEVKEKPANNEAPVVLAETFRELQKPDLANRALDDALSRSNLDANLILQIAQQ